MQLKPMPGGHIPEDLQQRICDDDGQLLAYLCFNRVATKAGPPNTHIAFQFAHDNTTVGLENHIIEFVKSNLPEGAPPLRTSQPPEYKPEQVQQAFEDDDDE